MLDKKNWSRSKIFIQHFAPRTMFMLVLKLLSFQFRSQYSIVQKRLISHTISPSCIMASCNLLTLSFFSSLPPTFAEKRARACVTIQGKGKVLCFPGRFCGWTTTVNLKTWCIFLLSSSSYIITDGRIRVHFFVLLSDISMSPNVTL